MNVSGMEKLPSESRFVDLSDYARPLAIRLVEFLRPHTAITPVTVTLVGAVVGLFAAVLIWNGAWLFLAGALLPVKSWIDAADGSLARARNRPSQVGRFTDSFCDFFVHMALFQAIAHLNGQSAVYAFVAFLFAVFQSSVYNYYHVIKRHACAGDCTSEIDQREMPEPYPWDNPAALKFLHTSYLVFYWWQDRLVYFLDTGAVEHGERLTSRFMTALSTLAMGFQLLVMCLLLWIDRSDLVLFYFTVPAMIYTLGLIAYRRFVLTRRSD